MLKDLLVFLVRLTNWIGSLISFYLNFEVSSNNANNKNNTSELIRADEPTKIDRQVESAKLIKDDYKEVEVEDNNNKETEMIESREINDLEMSWFSSCSTHCVQRTTSELDDFNDDGDKLDAITQASLTIPDSSPNDETQNGFPESICETITTRERKESSCHHQSIEDEIKREILDQYEQMKKEIETRTAFEHDQLPANILNKDKRQHLLQICGSLLNKVNEVERRNLQELDGYFAKLKRNSCTTCTCSSIGTTTSFDEYLMTESADFTITTTIDKEMVKQNALHSFCLFISNDCLLSDLRKVYPVGILCFSDFYLSPYQQAFLRNHFVNDDEMNWDKLTLKLVDLDLFDFQYKARHIGYHKENVFYLYKRNVIEQLIMSSYEQARVDDRENFYFFD